ncbi:hypothetical protein E4U43_001485 [Claviceps pusilla]|uniref:Uncharacterized protein n=1 Tax=Claviceps pusilla TaxID=123648 RepID=A0A9P7T3F9_9HYPO|nr:hypothetical protein E4U43_001485 [Claviceps pusilla]
MRPSASVSASNKSNSTEPAPIEADASGLKPELQSALKRGAATRGIDGLQAGLSRKEVRVGSWTTEGHSNASASCLPAMRQWEKLVRGGKLSRIAGQRGRDGMTVCLMQTYAWCVAKTACRNAACV